MRLSRRLEATARHVLPGQPAADIGADHGFLSAYLVKQGICPRVIIGELSDGPYHRASQYIRGQGLDAYIEVRQGNGLEVLSPGEVATVVIAGLGGKNIADILLHALAQAYTYRRFVFQPMRPCYPLRKLLADLGWEIINEEVVQENQDFYSIIVTEPRRAPAYELSDLELDLGPLILHQALQPEAREFLRQELARYERVIAGLKRSSAPGVGEKLALYHERIARLKEMVTIGHC